MKTRLFFTGLSIVFFTIGCGATQQWVEDYVSRETVSVKTEFGERLQPLEQGLADTKTMIEALGKEITKIDSTLNTHYEKLDDLSKKLNEESQSQKAEMAGVRKDMEREIKDLQKRLDAFEDKLGKVSTELLTVQKDVDEINKLFLVPPSAVH